MEIPMADPHPIERKPRGVLLPVTWHAQHGFGIFAEIARLGTLKRSRLDAISTPGPVQFDVVEDKGRRSWRVGATFPNAAPTSIGEFMSVTDAEEWIEDSSIRWLRARSNL
jgi:hypothetical protein